MRGRAGLCGIVCRQLIKHNDIISRKTGKGLYEGYFQTSSQTHFRWRGKKKKVKISSGGLYVVPDIFHIFITIKWQFNQRNEYCILIGVICTRISCIIHGGGDHRWVSRRYRLCSRRCVRRKRPQIALSRWRLICGNKTSLKRIINALIKNRLFFCFVLF